MTLSESGSIEPDYCFYIEHLSAGQGQNLQSSSQAIRQLRREFPG